MQISPKAILPFIPVAIAATTCAYSLKNHLYIYSIFNEAKKDFETAPLPSPREPILNNDYETPEPTYIPGSLPLAIGLIGAIILGTFAPATLSSSKEAFKISGVALAIHAFLTYRSKSLKQSIELLDWAFFPKGSAFSAKNKTFTFKTKSETDPIKQEILFSWLKQCLLHKAKGGDIKNFLEDCTDCPVEVVNNEDKSLLLCFKQES